MKSLLCLLLISCAPVLAQTPGVTAAWDTAENIATFAEQATRLKPMLDQLSPRDWVAKGAPEIYISQWENVRQELEYLSQAAETFRRSPEQLTAALDTYFRFESVEWRLESLVDAVRRYQNPAVGDLILGELRSNTANRDGLRQYITDLAAQKEQEFSIVDREAQRCRADLNSK